MYWLIAPLAIVVLVFLAGFRKTALGLLVAAVIAGAWIYRHNTEVQQRAATRISASQISLENLTVRRTFDASYEITGRIRNNSETYRIDGISFNVKIRDCAKSEPSQCVAIGEATANIAVTVPPQESRNFTGSLYYGKGHRQPKGTLAWDYEIKAITAKRQ